MKRECRLCGYESEDYVTLEVPLSSPLQEHAICGECLLDIQTFFGTDSVGPQPNPVFRPHVDGKIQKGKLKG